MRPNNDILMVLVSVLLAGCANNETLRRSTSTIGSEVAKLQADLSGLQTEIKTYLDDELARVTNSAARRDLALAMTRRQQAEWAVLRAKSEAELFSALRAQAREEALLLAEPAPTSPKPPAVALPFEKLGSVAASLDKLSKDPGTKADLEFLYKYGASVSKQLKALEESEKKKAAQASSGAKK